MTLTDQPPLLPAIEARAEALGFTMSSDAQVGALLAALAASKPGGRLLELGSGAGVGSAWLLHGMDATASLFSIDTDDTVLTIAREMLGDDRRAQFAIADASAALTQAPPAFYDLIFADAWPGKFSHLDEALATLKPGGVYVVDDLAPREDWPDGHQQVVDVYLEALAARSDLAIARTEWAKGVLIAVKRG